MADDTVYTISVHEGSAKSWSIGRIEMLGSNSLNELAAVLCESMLPKAGRPDDNGIDEHMWKFEVCRREWERDDDFRPASRPASQHSTTTQLAALLARPKHPLVVGGDEPFTFLYDYGTQSRLELRVVSAKPKPRISNGLAGALAPIVAASTSAVARSDRIARADNDAIATGRRIGLDEKYLMFAKAFLDLLLARRSAQLHDLKRITARRDRVEPVRLRHVLTRPLFHAAVRVPGGRRGGSQGVGEGSQHRAACHHRAGFPATMGSIDGAEERPPWAVAARPATAALPTETALGTR